MEQNDQKIEKRIKRQVKGKEHDFFAVYPIGFEQMGVSELTALGISNIKQVETGGFLFTAKVRDMIKATLLCRGAVRFLLRLTEFKSENFHSLTEKLKQKVAWELYLPQNTIPKISVSTAKSRLYHSDAIAERAEKSITEYFMALYPNQPITKSENQTIYLRLQQDRCTISLDCSGDPLYMRGYKKLVSKAPLRENIASLLLQQFPLENYSIIYDPMCGSGTFPIEVASLLGRGDLAHLRRFPFEDWPVFSKAEFEYIIRKQKEEEKKQQNTILIGSDIQSKSIDITRENGKEAGLTIGNFKEISITSHDLFLQQADFFQTARNQFPIEGKMLLICNPPYGKRLPVDTEKFFRRMGKILKEKYRNTDLLLITADESAEKSLQLPYKEKKIFRHGGLTVAALRIEIK